MIRSYGYNVKKAHKKRNVAPIEVRLRQDKKGIKVWEMRRQTVWFSSSLTINLQQNIENVLLLDT